MIDLFNHSYLAAIKKERRGFTAIVQMCSWVSVNYLQIISDYYSSHSQDVIIGNSLINFI